MAPLNRVYVLEGPSVVTIFAGTEPSEEKSQHVEWYVGYAPEREDDEAPRRVVICTLHAALESARIDLTVAATLVSDHTDDDLPLEQVADLIEESHALESLWDFARAHALIIAGSLDVPAELPYMSPDPKMRPLDRRSDVENEDGDGDSSDAMPAQ